MGLGKDHLKAGPQYGLSERDRQKDLQSTEKDRKIHVHTL